MEKLTIEGGGALKGEINVSGMKNSALPIIFATILLKGDSVIKNIPLVSDVLNSLEILREMGAKITVLDSHSVLINTDNISSEIKAHALISKMRASSYLMGTMLARFGHAELPMPGGCNFGVRPIEQHLKGFSLLGAVCNEENDFVLISTKNPLKSTKITLDKISVGATINIVLASLFIEGVTVIENVAVEPHVDDLIHFLNSAGAKIIRYGRRIFCEGVKQLHGVEYEIYPDMIEALTYLTYVGATGGEIVLKNTNTAHLSYVLDIFSKMGADVGITEREVKFRAYRALDGANVTTAPYPLFPTDLHPQFASLLCFSKNGGIIKEGIFPTRFAYVGELQKMGACMKQGNGYIEVLPSKLHSATVNATDLRAGAALICAALATHGVSTINNVNYIVRGYEDLTNKISSLGGKIKLLKGEQ
ncbi:MAG: UDP-N-acetylglucosamine 1-carboxyvinyltransferase [Clostridia bacterium]|nr:UDP-N-acetylglucosamine 1-carboxyvinyltransferase [Clostridia bacterium]